MLTSCKCQDCKTSHCPVLNYSAHLEAECVRNEEMVKGGRLLWPRPSPLRPPGPRYGSLKYTLTHLESLSNQDRYGLDFEDFGQ
jgi:hypothetical protein